VTMDLALVGIAFGNPLCRTGLGPSLCFRGLHILRRYFIHSADIPPRKHGMQSPNLSL